MTIDKEYHRPRKPYVVEVNQSQKPNSYNSQQKPFAKPKPKAVVVPNKNNVNNKYLHTALKDQSLVRVWVNNTLCSDAELAAVYEGHIVSFDDFTILLKTPVQDFLINKSAIAVMELCKKDEE